MRLIRHLRGIKLWTLAIGQSFYATAYRYSGLHNSCLLTSPPPTTNSTELSTVCWIAVSRFPHVLYIIALLFTPHVRRVIWIVVPVLVLCYHHHCLPTVWKQILQRHSFVAFLWDSELKCFDTVIPKNYFFPQKLTNSQFLGF